MTTIEELLDGAKAGASWTLDPARSRIAFRNGTFWGAAAVKGTFGDVRGGGTVCGGHSVVGHLDVGTASVSTGIAKRDAHLRSADFFDAAAFPSISVVVKDATLTQSSALELHATLTIKGIERWLDLPARVSVLGDGAVFIATHAEIDRRDFGVDGNLLGMVGHTTRLIGEAVFTPQAGDSS